MLSRTEIKKYTQIIAFFTVAIFSSTITLASDPEELKLAVILSAGIESPWDGTLIRDLEIVKAAKPHGLDVSWEYTDPLWGDDAGAAMRLFAETGEYDVIWAHAAYSDQVKTLKDEFPETMFVVVGSGNEGLGGNQYWVYKRVHEPAYLMGVIAGRMTKTNTIGVVGTYPADDANDEINSFFAGARSVNPDVKQKVAFIESWYDPAKAAEFTHAQISTGSDLIFQLAANFEPCEKAKILCFANFQDDHNYSPTTIVSSAVASWVPDVNWVIDAWWANKAEGSAFAGNTKIRWMGMADGGALLAPYHGLESSISDSVKAEVEALKAQIISGKFTVPLDVSVPKSN